MLRSEEIDVLAETLFVTEKSGGELTIHPGLYETLGAAVPETQTISQEPQSDFEKRGLLGEGGLGKVERYWQRSLAREVAVKSVRDDRLSEAAVATLLAEARVTGSLEHPGIVPVYAMVQNAEGQPGFAMKRAEGSSWHTLIHESYTNKEEYLQQHLEILLQLCNALQFAHSKGFLHRDIKPRNVIVGEFGEVYLLDWGLALPWQQTTEHGLFGTLQYMAPEMLQPSLPLGPHTDVYLLGACLHEVLTGEPPHKGESLRSCLLSIAATTPREYGVGVPYELAQICRRAMHADPAQRFQSTVELRHALRAFLQHRGAEALASSAPVATFLSVLSTTQGDDVQCRRLFVECRFALGQSLQQWPENELAKQRLAEVLAAMFHYELSLGNVVGAESILREMTTPPEGAAESLAKKKQLLAQEKESLQTLNYQFNPSISQVSRFWVILLGVLFFLVFTLCQIFFQDVFLMFQNRSILFLFTFLYFVVFGVIVWAKPSLFRTKISKYILSLAFVIDGMMAVNRAMGVFLETPISTLITVDFLLMIGLMILFSITVSRWFWRLVVLNSLFLLPVQLYPAYAFLDLSIAVGLCFVWILLSNNAYARSYQWNIMQEP